jgi:predicted RNA-binding protein YlxR (DUF448 family)/ribosomal protein L7Ae-like RNA K-turn-binding protein
MEAEVKSRQHDKTPTRTCAGCRVATAAGELVRVVLGEDRRLVVDLGAGAFGRGAWVHPRPECIERAAPRGFSKSFKSPVETTAAELRAGLVDAADRRVHGLLASARGARSVAVGTMATDEAIESGSARLVIVARDARAAAATTPAQRAIAAGQAVAWGDKSRRGAALGRGETGVVAVLDAGIARALRHAIAISHVDDSPATSGRIPKNPREGLAFSEKEG